MTDTISTRPHARPAAAGGSATAAEIAEVVRRAALVGDGLALLEGASPESAAVRLGVTPPAVERVRAALRDAAAHDAAVALLARCARAPEPAAPATARPPEDAAELLARAQGRPGGLALLLGACPECAAVGFGVRPHLVQAARELAARGGLVHAPPHGAEE
jgi:hypothetical protein